VNDIVVDNISISFDGKPVLDGFTHTFVGGTVSCVMGASGCGKTTLLNILLGIVKPDGGTVTGMPKKTACVFQEDRLCEDFSAVSNVRIASPSCFSKPDAEELLRLLGIDEFESGVRTFSGGMKRRVALARAIAADCEVILLDEAFKGLDTETRKNAIDGFNRRTAGKTVIAVTHDIEEAKMLGGEIVHLKGI